jgi:type IV secretory pathway VirJ component
VAIGALQLCSCTAVDTGVAERLSYGRFHEVRIYPPHPPVQHLALLLSGDGGWGSPLDAIASRLSDQGTLVAGIDVRDLFSSYARDPQSCVSPGAELAGLAHHLAQRHALPNAPPVLIGHSAGATLAYVALAQSPTGTFAGALTLSFCADLDLPKPLCAAPGLRSLPRTSGVRLLPSPTALPAPWSALHGLDDTVCPAAEAREFVGGLPGARFIGLPGITHSYHHLNRWWPAFEAAWRQLAAPAPGVSAP